MVQYECCNETSSVNIIVVCVPNKRTLWTDYSCTLSKQMFEETSLDLTFYITYHFPQFQLVQSR
jgi:hypothetical protein